MRERHKTQYPGIRYRLDKKGQRRYIVGWYVNGMYHTETLPAGFTLEDARLRRGELMGVVRRPPARKNVGELLDEYLADRCTNLKPKTNEDYAWAAGIVKNEIGHIQLKDLTPNHVARLISSLEGKKAWTVKKILLPLNGAMKVAVREGWVQANPLDALLRHEKPKADQKEMRCLSSEEIQGLLGPCLPRWRPLFSTLVFTGLRISEALALTWADVDFERNNISVREGKTPAAKREVMMIPSLRRLLLEHKMASLGDQVFPGTPSAAYSALERACKRAGIPRYSLHELRHTFASILISQGENPALIANQMGHANPKITFETYAHLFDAQKNIDLAREKLQAAFGGMV